MGFFTHGLITGRSNSVIPLYSNTFIPHHEQYERICLLFEDQYKTFLESSSI